MKKIMLFTSLTLIPAFYGIYFAFINRINTQNNEASDQRGESSLWNGNAFGER